MKGNASVDNLSWFREVIGARVKRAETFPGIYILKCAKLFRRNKANESVERRSLRGELVLLVACLLLTFMCEGDRNWRFKISHSMYLNYLPYLKRQEWNTYKVIFISLSVRLRRPFFSISHSFILSLKPFRLFLSTNLRTLKGRATSLEIKSV